MSANTTAAAVEKAEPDDYADHDPTFKDLVSETGKLEGLMKEILLKQQNMFGSSFATVASALETNSSGSENTAIIFLAPMVVRSFSSKDDGSSGKLYDRLGTFKKFKEHSTSGKANRTLIRLVCSAIVAFTKDDLFKSGSLEDKGHVEAKKCMTVFNPRGSVGSKDTEAIVRETVDKMGRIDPEVEMKIKNLVKAMVANSKYR